MAAALRDTCTGTMTPRPLPSRIRRTVVLASIALALRAVGSHAAAPYFLIKVVDAETGRGVPLVELRTVSQTLFVSDSSGFVAFSEPGLMGTPVHFSVRSHGYEYPRDGFGNSGVTLTPKAGGRAEVKLPRKNIAERIYRVTGEGIYRDSVLAGQPVPLREPLLNAQVAGQDSVQCATYRGKLFWLWGDTNRMRYPLGQFGTAGATSELPEHGGLAASKGIDLTYFTGTDGFSRPMWQLGEPGLVWTDGLTAVRDTKGSERLVARYARMKDLGNPLSQGIGAFDDEAGIFRRIREIPLAEKWRLPRGHSLRIKGADGDFIHFGNESALPMVRVKATYEALIEPSEFEAFTCIAAGAAFEGNATRIERDAQGRPLYRWTRDAAPLTQAQERTLIAAKLIPETDARWQVRDIESGKPVAVHEGSVTWNDFLKRWVLVFVERGGTSFLGEVWFAEADTPLGPWRDARKIVTHDNYSFYGVAHHAFFDEAGGRFIYFEGTYTYTFTKNAVATPRYDYNQIMYRLDVADTRLRHPPSK